MIEHKHSDQILFSESQRFSVWWLWTILLSINGLFLFGLYQQLILGIPFGDKPAPDFVLLLFAFGTLLLSLLFFFIRLKTSITDKGITIEFFPFLIKPKRYNWSEIQHFQIRKYNPLQEYGGWGIRYGFGKGTAYNIAGNMGLQLEMKNGKKLLIGTQKAEELHQAIPHTILSNDESN